MTSRADKGGKAHDPWPAFNTFHDDRLEDRSGDPSFMLSLARGMLVLHAIVDASSERLSLSKLAERTGLPISAVRRCLYTFNAIGYVDANRNGGIAGSRLTALTASHMASLPLLSHGQLILEELRDQLGMTVALGILEGIEGMMVAQAHAHTLSKMHVSVGKRFPLYCASVGRIFLAEMDREQVERYFDRIEMHEFTPKTITSKDKLFELLDVVRTEGYAVTDEEIEIGLRSISVAVRDKHNAVVAAITVGIYSDIGPSSILKTTILPAMFSTAAQLSRFLS